MINNCIVTRKAIVPSEIYDYENMDASRSRKVNVWRYDDWVNRTFDRQTSRKCFSLFFINQVRILLQAKYSDHGQNLNSVNSLDRLEVEISEESTGSMSFFRKCKKKFLKN